MTTPSWRSVSDTRHSVVRTPLELLKRLPWLAIAANPTTLPRSCCCSVRAGWPSATRRRRGVDTSNLASFLKHSRFFAAHPYYIPILGCCPWTRLAMFRIRVGNTLNLFVQLISSVKESWVHLLKNLYFLKHYVKKIYKLRPLAQLAGGVQIPWAVRGRKNVKDPMIIFGSLATAS